MRVNKAQKKKITVDDLLTFGFITSSGLMFPKYNLKSW
jgi:hypothetical protein